MNTTTPAPPRIGDPRHHTPDERVPKPGGGSAVRVRVKRCCNGCGTALGDLDDRDVDQHGNLTDVRPECPTCTPTAEPCTPLTVFSGPVDCLDSDCDEFVTENGEWAGINHCSHVTEEQVCETHSEFTPDEWEYCTKAVPWPHLAAAVPSAPEA